MEMLYREQPAGTACAASSAWLLAAVTAVDVLLPQLPARATRARACARCCCSGSDRRCWVRPAVCLAASSAMLMGLALARVLGCLVASDTGCRWAGFPVLLLGSAMRRLRRAEPEARRALRLSDGS